MKFSTLSTSDQLDALFPGHASLEAAPEGDLLLRCATIELRSFIIIAFDFNVAGGSMGVRECAQINYVFDQARTSQRDVIFMINSGGARVTEGVAAVASYSACLREVVDATLEGVNVHSLVAKHCYGGASVLAASGTDVRITSDAHFSMSGWRTIVKYETELLNCDITSQEVFSVIDGLSRSTVSDKFVLVEDVSESIKKSFDSVRAREDEKGSLAQLDARLLSGGNRTVVLGDDVVSTSREMFGKEWDGSGAFFRARECELSTHAEFAFVSDEFARADSVSRLINAIDSLNHEVSLVTIFVSCQSHSPFLEDEGQILSEYFSGLVIAMRKQQRRGVRFETIVFGDCGGGIFVSLSAGSSKVSVLPSARIKVLPDDVIKSLGQRPSADRAIDELVSVGLVDEVLPGDWIPTVAM